MTFRYTDLSGDRLTIEPGTGEDSAPVVALIAEQYMEAACVHIPLDHVEELIAAIHDAARAVNQQQPRETGQEATGSPRRASDGSVDADTPPRASQSRSAAPAEHCGQKAGALPHPPHKFMRGAHDTPTDQAFPAIPGKAEATPDCNAHDEPDSHHNPDLCTPTCWRTRHARYTTALITAYTGPPTGRTDRMAVAAMDLADHEAAQLRAELERYTEAESADAAAGSYAHRAVQAEAVLARVRALRDTWTASGPTPLGTSMSRWWDRCLVALNGALAEPGPAATQATEWTPPPPGDTREQLPDHLLALIRPYLRGYTSTACQTAGYLASVIADQPEHRAELIEWRQRMRKRCRRNQKYTGEICPHHTAKEN